MHDHGFKEAIKSMRNRGVRLDREGDIWNQTEKDRMEELFYEGVGISEIAIRLQRTEPAVIQQIEKMDLYQRKNYPKRHRHSAELGGCLCQKCKDKHGFCRKQIYGEYQETKNLKT